MSYDKEAVKVETVVKEWRDIAPRAHQKAPGIIRTMVNEMRTLSLVDQGLLRQGVVQATKELLDLERQLLEIEKLQRGG